MRAVVQRVSRAEVRIEGEVVGRIDRGFAVLVAAATDDGPAEVAWLADKILGLRVFADANGQMNLGLADVGGAILAISQFTLYGDCRKGRRPSFTAAAPPEPAERLYEAFVTRLREGGAAVETGRFRALMEVDLVNDGPVTQLLDSSKLF